MNAWHFQLRCDLFHLSTLLLCPYAKLLLLHCYLLCRKNPYTEHYDKVKVNEYMDLDKLAKILEALVKKYPGMFVDRVYLIQCYYVLVNSHKCSCGLHFLLSSHQIIENTFYFQSK